MLSDRQNIIDGQFDDAQEVQSDALPADHRQVGHFIDDDQLLEWSEESAGEEDEEEMDDGYDDTRIEDEDWEVAEGGMVIINQLYWYLI